MTETAFETSLEPDLLRRVRPFFSIIDCPAGEAVIQQGEQVRCFYHIEKGRVEASYLEGETRIVAALIGPGQFLGEIGYFDRILRLRDVRTITPARLIRFDEASMDRLLKEDPPAYGRLLECVTRAICLKFRRILEEREPIKTYAAALARPERETPFSASPPDGFFSTPQWKRASEAAEAFRTAMFELSYGLQSDANPSLSEGFEEKGGAVLDALKRSLDAFSDDEMDAEKMRHVWGYIFKEIFPYLMRSRFAERAHYKPKGYAGDYLMINMIYDKIPDGDGKIGRIVDAWALNSMACEAVRGRRRLLADALARICGDLQNGDDPIRIMSLACGPSREMADFLDCCEARAAIEALLVDIDADALTYSHERLKSYAHKARLRFMNENVIKWAIGRVKQEIDPQDIIYSAGLTDYLEDRLFVKLVARCHVHLKPGGTLILGNFGPRNPDRAFMEHILDWRLIHRSEAQLKALFGETPFGTDVEILSEPLGINLFVKAVK